jgi:hypothetical protein
MRLIILVIIHSVLGAFLAASCHAERRLSAPGGCPAGSDGRVVLDYGGPLTAQGH